MSRHTVLAYVDFIPSETSAPTPRTMRSKDDKVDAFPPTGPSGRVGPTLWLDEAVDKSDRSESVAKRSCLRTAKKNGFLLISIS